MAVMFKLNKIQIALDL